MLARSFRFKFALFLLLLGTALFLARDLWLSALGAALVHDDGAGNAEIAVVLAGDYAGDRLTKGAELVKQGYVPRVLVSGPPGFYGVNEADAALRFAIGKGYPAEWFIPLRHTALSTREEAAVVLDALKQRNIRSFLLVTSDYHTARARRIYRNAISQRGGGPDLRVVASGDRFFSAANWWRHREGRKTAFMEWTKTLTSVFGI
ncbi:MAG: YdcF family protein [Candidatus Solibacter sp.]|nr:YdcF family protein [Candidatus Solibacter sp.]